jgi:hypothetical protein
MAFRLLPPIFPLRNGEEGLVAWRQNVDSNINTSKLADRKLMLR